MPRSLFLLPLLFLAGCSRNGPTPDAKPSPGREGLTWTRKELLDHLKARGVAFTQSERNPAVIGSDDDTAVVIQIFPNAQAAKDAGGVMGDQAFSWGRFLIAVEQDGNRAFLDAVKKALD